jgi:hypothetical protein
MTNNVKETLFYNKYYGFLKDAKITSAGVMEDDNELWPYIDIVASDGGTYRLEISQDPEGNGPGFIFGLPSVEVKS